jgi:hypothetical protein
MSPRDRAQEHVLTELARICTECAERFMDADIKEMAEESGLSIREIEESTRIMTKAKAV